MQISLASLEKPPESTGNPYECPSSVRARLNSTASGPQAPYVQLRMSMIDELPT